MAEPLTPPAIAAPEQNVPIALVLMACASVTISILWGVMRLGAQGIESHPFIASPPLDTPVDPC